MWLVLGFVGRLILAFGLLLESFWEHLRSLLENSEIDKEKDVRNFYIIASSCYC